MASGTGHLQFRNMQPPSKVIHLRNLPWECGEEELIELCKPFGNVMNTKVNVGANRNQAFVEFADMNQAISMISYYASSSEPAQIRGRSVYLQYSNRQEIINSKNSGDTASNVLLVTIEGVEAGDVFSAFGFVHKIATFEKTAGFQALVQYSDPNTALSAKTALDGRSIPRYLLPEHVASCHLHISFSAHTDLSVKFQSHRSRDYTNPYLPVAPSAITGTGQLPVGLDGMAKEPESNVLLASVENMQYAITLDIIHTVFSAFGFVQKIAIFEKNNCFQALVQYPDVATAVMAKGALEGHCIYEGGYCKLHLSYSRHTDLNVKVNNDRSRDYTNPNLGFQNSPSILGQQISAHTTMPMIVGGVADAHLENLFIDSIHSPQPDAGAGMPQVQGWGYTAAAGVSSIPASSPIAGSISSPMYDGSTLSSGETAVGGMFPHYGAPTGPASISSPYPTTANGETGMGMLPANALGRLDPSPVQSMASFNQQQSVCMPGGPAVPPFGMPSSASGPPSQYT